MIPKALSWYNTKYVQWVLHVVEKEYGTPLGYWYVGISQKLNTRIFLCLRDVGRAEDAARGVGGVEETAVWFIFSQNFVALAISYSVKFLFLPEWI